MGESVFSEDVTTLVQDFRLSLRQAARQPVFTLTAVLTLAIGLGVNAVAFTVVNGLLFKSTAIGISDHVGRILTTPEGNEEGYASLPEYRRLAEFARGTLDVAAEGRLSMAWRRGGNDPGGGAISGRWASLWLEAGSSKRGRRGAK